MKDETTPVWRENLSTILCYLNDDNLAGQLTRRELPFSRELVAISFVRKNLLNMARSIYVCIWTHCICKICLLRNKFDQPGPVNSSLHIWKCFPSGKPNWSPYHLLCLWCLMFIYLYTDQHVRILSIRVHLFASENKSKHTLLCHWLHWYSISDGNEHLSIFP